MDVKIIKRKIVVTRKVHKCWKCEKEIKKKTKMQVDIIITDERILNAYQCLKCK